MLLEYFRFLVQKNPFCQCYQGVYLSLDISSEWEHPGMFSDFGILFSPRISRNILLLLQPNSSRMTPFSTLQRQQQLCACLQTLPPKTSQQRKLQANKSESMNVIGGFRMPRFQNMCELKQTKPQGDTRPIWPLTVIGFRLGKTG